MRVHVTLERRLTRHPAARQAALERVLAAGETALANPGRFERHGIITAEMDPGLVARVGAVKGVLGAELDEPALGWA